MLQLSFSSPLLANAGVPLFSANIFWQIVVLIPIFLIELFVHRKFLKTSTLKSLRISITTNILSTLAGILSLFVFAPLFLAYDDFSPPLNSSSLPKFVLLRLMGLLFMWFISVWIEYWSGLFLTPRIEKKVIKKSFLIANTLSYLFLAVVMASTMTTSLLRSYDSIATLQKELEELNQQCPVIEKSNVCDQVFHQRVEAYQKLRGIYRYHNTSFEMQSELNQLIMETQKTCSPNDQRVVCLEVAR